MKAELKQEWIAALASGDFTQTQGLLWREENGRAEVQRAGHCCLGVLCVITNTHIPNGQGMLPESLAEEAGLDQDIEVPNEDGDEPLGQSLQEFLADVNDNHDDNFASVIEAIKERVPSE